MNRELLNQELSKIEKPAGIANPKDFRNEVVKFALRRARPTMAARTRPGPPTRRCARSSSGACSRQVEDLLPVISFGTKKDSDTEKKHADFLERMVSRGYTSARCAGWSSGTCASTRPARRARQPRRRQAPMNIVDRRPNPEGKSLSNRQRFMRRARAEVKRAVQEACASAKVGEAEDGEKVAIPTRGITEPLFHLGRDAGERDYVVPGNKEYHRSATRSRGRQGGGGGRGSQGSPDGERRGRLRVHALEGRVPRPVLRGSRAARPGQEASSRTEGAAICSAPAITVDGTPANLNLRAHHAQQPGAGASRCTARSHRRSSALRGGLDAPLAPRRRRGRRRLARAATRDSSASSGAKSIAYIDPVDVRYNRFERVPSRTPRR